ncbi:MAG: hypothetical protein J5840_07930 [Lachnospiraceae bacterium]|nr:hypothetical protein [Lachnospiraceae bacterium]MBO4678589.1 hypothetical protein [Lachnospiraceae bacterium]
MNYIIEIEKGLWFLGWSPLDGTMQVTKEVTLAYRMRRTVATRTLPKVIDKYGSGRIVKLVITTAASA